MPLDATASVYALVKNTKAQREIINSVRMMNIISREIENAVIQDGVKARVFSGFQRISRFLPQAKRYQQLADKAESVYVFAEFDVKPPAIPKVKYIEIAPTDQLAREWFIIADAPDYYTALVTEELANQDRQDRDRKFQGVWSFDEEMVEILQAWLSRTVGVRAYDAHVENRDYIRHIALMSNSVNRLTARLSKLMM